MQNHTDCEELHGPRPCQDKKQIEQLLDVLSKKTGKAKSSQSKQEYSQYLMMEIVNRAVTTVFEKRH